MKKPESICVFGDSTAWGAWDEEKGGWVSRLWFYVGNRDPDYVEIYNLSISGGSSQMILDRFENEAKIRGADALIFQTGGNDASREHGKSEHRVSPEKFAENIGSIIEQAKKITNNIIFVGLKNCDESKTTPVSWVDVDYTNADHEEYNQIMKKVCEAHGVLFVATPHLENEEFEDGIHPNSAGHQKLFVHIKDFLEARGWI